MDSRYRAALTILLVFSISAIGWGAKPKPWDELSGCRIIPHSGNDGDSFHVDHDGKEYIFRLCFVDCPESSDSLQKRVEEQAEWWGIEERAVLLRGADATVFTRNFLKDEFTVFTRYDDARGRSVLKRNFAMIRVGNRFLCEALVKAGLARTYGYPCVLPTGQSAKSYRAQLDLLEERARNERKGAWATTDLKPLDDDEVPGKQITLTRALALYGDPSGQYVGNAKVGSVVFVPEQPERRMVKLRAPLRGRVVDAQCRRRDLAQ